jgi:Tat protein secretion system quality control protein TatD with DNase activity
LIVIEKNLEERQTTSVSKSMKKNFSSPKFVYYAAEAFAHTKNPTTKKLLKEIFHNVKEALKTR